MGITPSVAEAREDAARIKREATSSASSAMVEAAPMPEKADDPAQVQQAAATKAREGPGQAGQQGLTEARHDDTARDSSSGRRRGGRPPRQAGPKRRHRRPPRHGDPGRPGAAWRGTRVAHGRLARLRPVGIGDRLRGPLGRRLVAGRACGGATSATSTPATRTATMSRTTPQASPRSPWTRRRCTGFRGRTPRRARKPARRHTARACARAVVERSTS